MRIRLLEKDKISLAYVLMVFVGLPCFGQAVSVGIPLFEEDIRTMQLKNLDSTGASLMIRPNFQAGRNNAAYYKWIGGGKSDGKKVKAYLLPAIVKQQYNSHHPYGWNDGAMIGAKGYQQQLSAGVYVEAGPLSVQLQPEFVMAQNSSFQSFPSAHTDSVWKAYYTFLNHTDLPERMGDGRYTRLFPGQSSIRLNFRKMSFGLSTENLWWGPGYRNSLIMSNTAPGFLHLTFNSRGPIKTPIGGFEWQIVGGRLKESGVLPPDTVRRFENQPLYVPKPPGNRYINAATISWQPRWVRGLYLGFARSFYQYEHSLGKGLNDYLPVFSFFFKGNSRSEDDFGRDQMLSFYLRWVFDKEAAEIYAEYGRNDHSGNATDFLLEPEHSRAYIIGLRKLFSGLARKRDLEFFMEFSNLEGGKSGLVRDIPTWYQHHQIKHGYTNRGQLIGAGIGPGSNSQTVGLTWVKTLNRTGVFFERIARQNDFYYEAFSTYRNSRSHWVDLSLNAHKSLQYDKFLLSAQLGFIYSLNYQWRNKQHPATLLNGKSNATNLVVGVTVGYSLGR